MATTVATGTGYSCVGYAQTSLATWILHILYSHTSSFLWKIPTDPPYICTLISDCVARVNGELPVIARGAQRGGAGLQVSFFGSEQESEQPLI